MYVPCLSLFLELIGDHNIGSVNIVSNDFSTDDTSDDFSCVDTDSHV